ncbi:MAG: SRPBCC family protein [Pseudomonadota bacterium]
MQLTVHLVAAAVALAYAWAVSQTAYVTSALQFVAPALLIMAVHFGFLAVSRRLAGGFSAVVLRRSVQTALMAACAVFVASLIAPEPAQAGVGDALGQVLGIVFCLSVLLVIAAVAAAVVYLFFLLLRGILRATGLVGPKGPDSRLFDAGSLGLVAAALAIASVEGTTGALTFPSEQRAVASRSIDAPAGDVWQTMERATSPAFPLPGVLSVFPQPVDVVTDEGTALGANRQVAFSGREGGGVLSLRVVERTEHAARFEVLSDTTPYAEWIGYTALTYRVTPTGDGTELHVALDFDRKLAPAWFFAPMMQAAARLAMGVLADDVKSRAER